VKDAPCNANEAVNRARRIVGDGGQYILGTGDYWPHTQAGNTVDLPWTAKKGLWGTDCSGFAVCYAWKLRRSRPGFNRGSWSTVSDDINTDSVFEDATHLRELGEVVDTPRPGDLLLYPGVRRDGRRILVGHVSLIERVPAEWDASNPQYDLLTVIQSYGPNGRKPAVRRTDGSIWDRHDDSWSKHKSVIIRMKERP
jgi:hypothetical protein